MDTSHDEKRKRVEVDWLNLLPKELWAHIAKRLHATIDVLQFRRTCKTWRSAAPLPPPLSTKSLLPPQIIIPLTNFTLVETRIYSLQPCSTSTPSDSCSSSNKGWIIMIGDSKSFPLRLLDPFTNLPISPSPKRSSRTPLNLTDFRFVELVEGYSLNTETEGLFEPVPEVLKVILFPNPSSPGGPRMVFVLYNDGALCVSKIGDENWNAIVLDDDGYNNNNNNYSCFDDMISCMGQVYVVDKWGTVLWVDCSALKLLQFSPLLCGFGTKKHLVECNGSLHVVDVYIDEKDPIGVKVYRLDEEWGRWLDVKNLGHDIAFVLGKDSNFFLSCRDCYGCEGNCVYFYSRGQLFAFNVKTSTFKSPTVFWPCPSFFFHTHNLCRFNPSRRLRF